MNALGCFMNACVRVVNVNEEREQACQAEAAILLDLFWGDFDSIRQGRMCEWVSEWDRASEWVIEWLSKSIRYSRTANMNWTSTTSTLSTVWLWFVYTMKLLAVLPCRHVAMCHVPCAMLHCRMKQSEKKQVKWLMIMLNANARINDNELNWTNCQLTRQFERAKQANREWKWALDKQSVWERQRDRESESWKRESVWLNRA